MVLCDTIIEHIFMRMKRRFGMKKMTAKRALLSSILSLLLCVSMLVGTTFAWFTDSVTSGSNIIAAGNLDVEMYWADGTKNVPADDADWTDASEGAIFDYDNWEPGYTEVKYLKIVNKGNLAFQYKINLLSVFAYVFDSIIILAKSTSLSLQN